jgi:crotonobetainyl-CoA:carnitine CoA-transferase CaiB-like acyl-CoA transferase
MKTSLPLKGVRVVELGVAIAGPFVTSLLSDLGAEVIKVERPGEGDTTREFGHQVNGTKVWWGISARNKKCITLDLKAEKDRERLKQLLASADVFVENFRTGVVDRLGFGWKTISEVNPRLIMISVSGFGQTGPESGRPGFGKIAEAMSGITALTGRSEEHPLHVGFSLADAATGLMGFFAVSIALYSRDVANGRGAYVDLALYESLYRMAECQMALTNKIGRSPVRTGSNDPYGWGMSGDDDAVIRCLKTVDQKWIAVLLDKQTVKKAAGVLSCAAVSDSVVAALNEKIKIMDCSGARKILAEYGIKGAQVHDGATIAKTPYFQKRGDVLRTHDERIGEFSVAAVLPRMYSRDDVHLFRTPMLGENNADLITLPE